MIMIKIDRPPVPSWY